jgi:Ca2+-binding EF-hand superfamily protein
MIDVNKDGSVDFNEFLVVVVLINRLNDLGSRLSFVFDMYRFLIVCKIFFLLWLFSRWDESDDGSIDQKELANVISAIVNVLHQLVCLMMIIECLVWSYGYNWSKRWTRSEKTCERNYC